MLLTKAAVASSSNKILGFKIRALATATRARCPPDLFSACQRKRRNKTEKQFLQLDSSFSDLSVISVLKFHDKVVAVCLSCSIVNHFFRHSRFVFNSKQNVVTNRSREQCWLLRDITNLTSVNCWIKLANVDSVVKNVTLLRICTRMKNKKEHPFFRFTVKSFNQLNDCRFSRSTLPNQSSDSVRTKLQTLVKQKQTTFFFFATKKLLQTKLP